MKIINVPAKFPIPFAASAGGGFINSIPQASQIGITAGAASLTDGFPPATFLPVGSGGTPPFGQDFNGLLKQITQWNQWQGAGALVQWDSAFSTSIGGYPKGALIAGLATGVLWLCTVDDNITNPDTGGAGWFSLNTGRLIGVQVFNAAGTFTYTPTAGTVSGVVEVCGGGGSGNGCQTTTGSQNAAGAGGGAGGYAIKFIAAITSQTVTIGIGGVGVNGSPGAAGGSSSFGAIVSATGGAGGASTGGLAAPPNPTGTILAQGTGAGGVGSSGDVNEAGAAGLYGLNMTATAVGGTGGASHFGGGAAPGSSASGGVNGQNAVSFGAGGSGGCTFGVASNVKGGNGANGLVLVWEYA